MRCSLSTPNSVMSTKIALRVLSLAVSRGCPRSNSSRLPSRRPRPPGRASVCVPKAQRRTQRLGVAYRRDAALGFGGDPPRHRRCVGVGGRHRWLLQERSSICSWTHQLGGGLSVRHQLGGGDDSVAASPSQPPHSAAASSVLLLPPASSGSSAAAFLTSRRAADTSTHPLWMQLLVLGASALAPPRDIKCISQHGRPWLGLFLNGGGSSAAAPKYGMKQSTGWASFQEKNQQSTEHSLLDGLGKGRLDETHSMGMCCRDAFGREDD